MSYTTLLISTYDENGNQLFLVREQIWKKGEEEEATFYFPITEWSHTYSEILKDLKINKKDILCLRDLGECAPEYSGGDNSDMKLVEIPYSKAKAITKMKKKYDYDGDAILITTQQLLMHGKRICLVMYARASYCLSENLKWLKVNA